MEQETLLMLVMVIVILQIFTQWTKNRQIDKNLRILEEDIRLIKDNVKHTLGDLERRHKELSSLVSGNDHMKGIPR